MNVTRLVLAEAVHRKVSSLLMLVAIVAAVALVVFFITTGSAAERETRVLMRDTGLNVIILPKSANLDRYFARGFVDESMPAEYIERLASQDVANRLIPMLRRRASWHGREIMLTGIAGEIFADGKQKPGRIGVQVPPGKLVVGAVTARQLGLQPGQEVELLGESFHVDRCLVEKGTVEDITVYANLADVQRLLSLEGRLNEIQALECFCSEDERDPLARLRAELEPLLPEAQIVRRSAIADARQQQRRMAQNFFGLLVPVSVVFAAVWIAAVAMVNVRDRRREIGLLHALGYRRAALACLFLGKAALLGILGAVLGVMLGGWIASAFGPDVFKVTAKAIHVDASVVIITIIAAPLFAAIACFIPTMFAAAQDPAVHLCEE